MIKFTYSVMINGVKKGDVIVMDTSSKKAEKKATKLIKDSYELSDNDVVGLIITNLELIGE